MPDPMAVREYLDRVRDALGDAPDAVDVLAELEAHIRDERERRGGDDAACEAVLAELGEPEAYAAAMRDAASGHRAPSGAVDERVEPQGRLLGMPYDFRGPGAGRLTDRIWNPDDPRVWMPRTFGLGWTLNFAALAVRLGLARPDDFADDPFADAPAWSLRVAGAVPIMLAAALVTLTVVAWSSLPARVPTHWNAAGAVDGWWPKPVALGLLLAFGVLPVVMVAARSRRVPASPRQRTSRAAGLTFASALALGIGVLTVRDAGGATASGDAMWVVIALSVLLTFLVLFVPARLGLSAEQRGGLARRPDGGSERSER